MRLCEQLRLVLEPTLATRLQGDYRIGKRINMRRVIGYVASGFRKDKIWLRRTKPAKREYQVMLMIDDSKSMGEAGPLALSALATISNALSKLEVGDLSVCAFAEGVRQLHPFGRPFNEEAGAHVVSQFTFEQDRTLLGASLSAVAPIFSEAASSASSSSGPAAVCLQICFVISDARLDGDNRLRLDSVVRKMAEQNILVVLIILDKNDDPKDSIFNTKSVEFEGDKIVTKNYLDDFPFPYYIAIQKLDVLPDVLADALKQWFELIGSQIDSA
jgi:midasin